MRIKIISIVFSVVMCSTLLTGVFSELGRAEPAKLIIVEGPSYYLYRAESHPSKYYYYINVTFYNSGDEQSVPVDIKILEDGLTASWPPECHSWVFKAHENKTFTFDWGTTLAYRSIELVYAPSDADILPNADNSGSRTIEIGSSSSDEEETPGFEFSLIVLISIIIICLKRFKVKKYN